MTGLTLKRRAGAGWFHVLLGGGLIWLATGNSPAAGFRLQRLAGGLHEPTCAAYAPGDTNAVYVAEYAVATNELGRILRIDLLTGSQTVFLDLSGLVAANAFNGLLQFAFHPGYATNGRFYVTYQFRVGSNPRVGRLAEYRLTNGVPVFVRTLLEHNLNAGHSINMPFFRPGGDPNHLFVTTGDGGPEAGSTAYTTNRAQNLATTWGKLLRLDVGEGLDAYPADVRKNFGIPAANTAVTNPPGRLGEVIAAGFRNPWRAGFDALTGDLFIGDNGFHTAEEYDFIRNEVIYPVSTAIPDYGWPAFEGIYHPVPSGNAFVQGLPTNSAMLQPILSRTAAVLDPGVDITGDGIPDVTGDGDDSAIGGLVYRGPIEEFYGKYICADFQANRVYAFAFDRAKLPTEYDGTNVTGLTNITAWLESTLPGAELNSIVGFVTDPWGHLVLVDHGGEIFRLVPAAGAPVLGLSGSPGGPWTLEANGPPGLLAVVEVSTNLVGWTEAQTNWLPFSLGMTNSPVEAQQFFRARQAD